MYGYYMCTPCRQIELLLSWMTLNFFVAFAGKALAYPGTQTDRSTGLESA